VCSVEEDDSAGYVNSCEKISGKFVVACCNSSKVLEFIEEPLDEIALAVEREVTRPWGLAVGLWWDHGSDSPVGQPVDQVVSIVGLVADQSIRVGVLDQRLRAGQIVSLAWCQHQVDGIAQSIDQSVDLGS
jgi:hypothetical protein